MHCSLCGYKSKCPLAMEKHRIDRHKSDSDRLDFSTIFVSDVQNRRLAEPVLSRSSSQGSESLIIADKTNF